MLCLWVLGAEDGDVFDYLLSSAAAAEGGKNKGDLGLE
jgi:hypothetical protein